ncbi:MAG: Flp pilus assembly protein CpaB [Alphaproteobacteria bacterium]|nr:MAG: Flp pilus assembly protein CpaB [Alphaproteobacteria bacterium]
MNVNLRSVVLIVAALVIAGATAFLARSWVAAERPADVAAAPAPVTDLEILVAKTDLPAGRILQEGDLRWQAWPDVDLPDEYIRKLTGREPADLHGSVVRTGLRAGEPLSRSRVAAPGERGFLAAVLSPGMRAVSVKVDSTTGIAGFVFPGDRVDLILSHRVEDRDARTQHRASETVLTNVRVLAIDQRTDDQTNTPAVVKTVTLEVTPRQAERVALARELGNLSLSLRSLANPDVDVAAATLEPAAPDIGKTYTWDSDVSRVLSGKGNNGSAVMVARGSALERVNVESGK